MPRIKYLEVIGLKVKRGKPLFSMESHCPNCSYVLEKRPTRKTTCPHCGVFIYCRSGKLMTEDQIDLEHAKFRAMQTEETLKACDEWDNDLVQVSSHANPCEICAPYAGKIFSIHGKTPGYPILKEKPPFCKKCRHSLGPTSLEGIYCREKEKVGVK